VAVAQPQAVVAPEVAAAEALPQPVAEAGVVAAEALPLAAEVVALPQPAAAAAVQLPQARAAVAAVPPRVQAGAEARPLPELEAGAVEAEARLARWRPAKASRHWPAVAEEAAARAAWPRQLQAS